MGKKKNKNYYWGDLDDANSQSKIADSFFKAETALNKGKKINEDGLLPFMGKKSHINSSTGLDYRLEELICSDISKDVEEEMSDVAIPWSNISSDNESGLAIDIDSAVSIVAPKTNENVPKQMLTMSTARMVHYLVDKVLNRSIITDEISPTSINLMVALKEEIELKDDIDIRDTIDLLNLYIVSLKHPTAIYTFSEFNEKFNSVSEYDDNKFMLFNVDEKWVFAYMIDEESKKEFDEMLSVLSDKERLAVYVSVAYAAGTCHQAFFGDEDTIITDIYNNNDLNDKSLFEEAIFNDDGTTLGGVLSTSDDDEIDVYDYKMTQSESRIILNELSGDYDFDDDEEEESVEVENEDIDDKEDDTDVLRRKGDEDDKVIESDTVENADEDDKVIESKEKEIEEILDATPDQMVDLLSDEDSTKKGIDTVPLNDEKEDFIVPVIR